MLKNDFYKKIAKLAHNHNRNVIIILKNGAKVLEAAQIKNVGIVSTYNNDFDSPRRYWAGNLNFIANDQLGQTQEWQ